MLKAFFKESALECGTDEAGRGCLCGPVVAAAVIFQPEFSHPLFNDSKQLSERKRNELRLVIEKEALVYSVSFVSPQKIDEINILQASILAMHQAIADLKVSPKFIIVDGNKFKPYLQIPHQTIVKGDSKFQSIAAASILAKTYRDEYMEALHLEFPQYDWYKNKGYPTLFHRKALQQFGSTIHHRMSFRLLPDQLKLEI
ncbi:MAG: ribonuclease HII [Flavobacteriaceae bacterium]|nr:ribonuclease HII [Flavobacteriaceae bacterium]